MIFVFTYHKVRETSPGDASNFYTVTPGQLSRHLELLQTRGLRSLKIDDLLAAPAVPENKFILTFDDATTDHLEVVAPILARHNCHAVFFIPTSRLNQPGSLTNSQVKELNAAGHAIGFHSHEHRRLDLLSREEIRRQIALSQKIIADLVGFKPVLFVPPGGFIDSRVRDIALELGVRVIRTMRWGFNKKLDLMALETIPLNRYISDREFVRIMETTTVPFMYAAKEALKHLIPLRSYEFLRNLLFRISKSD